MKALFARYGGHSFTIGQGRTSNRLPEDQSLDNILDNYSFQPVPGIIYLNSYIERPEFMGHYTHLPKRYTLLGTLEHTFTDMMFQANIETRSKIYIGSFGYRNVYGLFIQTDDSPLKIFIDIPYERNPGYDLVQLFYIKGLQEEFQELNKTPEQLEMMLIILCHHMQLAGSDVTFTPSKTWLGKLVDSQFPEKLNQLMEQYHNEDSFAKILTAYMSSLKDKMNPKDEQ